MAAKKAYLYKVYGERGDGTSLYLGEFSSRFNVFAVKTAQRLKKAYTISTGRKAWIDKRAY